VRTLCGQGGGVIEPEWIFFGQKGRKCQFFAILRGRLLWMGP